MGKFAKFVMWMALACAAMPAAAQDNTPELSLEALQARAAALFQTAGRISARPATWAARAIALEETLRDATDADDRRATLRAQIEALETEAMFARAIPALVRDVDLRRCINAALRECTVRDAGSLKSRDGGIEIFWQAEHGHTEETGVIAGFVLMQRQGANWAVIGWTFEGALTGIPALIERADATLLHAPSRSGGTGAHNTDLLLRHEGARWQEIEMESWKDAMRGKLAPLAVWKGVTYDLAAMRAMTPVWTQRDANCCPTGGAALADLAIEGARVKLVSVQHVPMGR